MGDNGIHSDFSAPAGKGAGADFSRKAFAPIEKFFADAPSGVFDDPDYYKNALSGGGEAAERLHGAFAKYLAAKTPEDKGVYRQQVTSAYWEFLRALAPRLSSPHLPAAKRMLVRFGVLSPKLFTPEQKDLFSAIIIENTADEPVLYLDEWLAAVGAGEIEPSASDEARVKKDGAGGEAQRLLHLKSRNDGKTQAAEGALAVHEARRREAEAELRCRVDALCEHEPLPDLIGRLAPLTEEQRRAGMDISEIVKRLFHADKEIASGLQDLRDALEISRSLESKLEALPAGAEADTDVTGVRQEFDTVRQMAKMSVGRQGNGFPLFSREYFHCLPRETGTRENVLAALAWIESVDPGVFSRMHKGTQLRIVPYTLLLPAYGDSGICWEPFNRYNRASSRGRIAVPMYPRNLREAVITAAADLRWQTAKEKAAYYWMEEGLTGQFYQWFTAQKMRGDIKDAFAENYLVWLTKEYEGVQKLDKDVRAIFWRHIPFPQDVKDKLKTRAPVYQELCRRDANRAMSDGY